MKTKNGKKFMTTKPTDPLTVEEMQDAAEHFVKLYKVVAKELPDATVEDIIKIMEPIGKLAHKKRADKKKSVGPFGFNKGEKNDD